MWRTTMDIDTIFKTYYRPLCLYALHYLPGHLEQAEDIVQDGFLKLWKAQPQNPKAFLYTAVRNACIDSIRKSKTVTMEILPQDLDGDITDSEAQERSYREAELWTAIDHLPERCRQIFLMSKRYGMTYREIAAELNLSERTVEHQVSKALKRLKAHRQDLLFVLAFLL